MFSPVISQNEHKPIARAANFRGRRRFGLDRTFSKLDETAKTEAPLILLAMNASLRLVRGFAQFFRSPLLPCQFPCFSADPIYFSNSPIE